MSKNSGKSLVPDSATGVPSPALSSYDPGYSFASPFSTLSRPGEIDFKVAGYHKGLVRLYVDLPEELIHGLVHLMESAHELLQATSRRTKNLQAMEKVHDLTEQLRREEFKAGFDQRICAVFDELVKQGVPAKEAIKRTNAAIKAEGYANTSYDIVSSCLRAAGRLKGLSLYKKGR